jgi:hypothetical protein
VSWVCVVLNVTGWSLFGCFYALWDIQRRRAKLFEALWRSAAFAPAKTQQVDNSDKRSTEERRRPWLN